MIQNNARPLPRWSRDLSIRQGIEIKAFTIFVEIDVRKVSAGRDGGGLDAVNPSDGR